jgi:hypothetical protein
VSTSSRSEVVDFCPPKKTAGKQRKNNATMSYGIESLPTVDYTSTFLRNEHCMLQQELKHRYVRLGMSVVAVHGVAIAAVEGSGAEVNVALDKIDKNFANIHSFRTSIFPPILNSILDVPWERQAENLQLRQDRGAAIV